MTGEWREVVLWDVAEYINGRPTKPSELCDYGVPVIKIAELNRGITDRTDRISGNLVNEQHWVQEGDLLFAWSGSVGIYRYQGPKAALNQHIFKVAAKRGYDQRYIQYLLQSCLPVFLNHVEDKKTTMGHVTVQDLQRISVRVPALPEQRAIAHILGTLDDKIELNRRMSETLEGMARALFKAWFVDFEPVRAKMAGRPPASAPGPLADLFPARLVPSELGDIPQGWRVGRLGDLIEFVKGKKPLETCSSPGNGLYPVVLIEMLDTGISSMYASAKDMVLAASDDILMVMDGASSGRVETGCAGLVGSTLAKLALKDKSIGKRFIYYFLKHMEPESRSHLTGTSIPHADRSWLSNLEFCIPADRVMKWFENFANEVRTRMEHIREESRTLAALRDTLLPKLIRGEIRVQDAERLVLQSAQNIEKEN